MSKQTVYEKLTEYVETDEEYEIENEPMQIFLEMLKVFLEDELPNCIENEDIKDKDSFVDMLVHSLINTVYQKYKKELYFELEKKLDH